MWFIFNDCSTMHHESERAQGSDSVQYLGELSELQDVSLSQTLDDALPLSGHILILLSQSSHLGELSDGPVRRSTESHFIPTEEDLKKIKKI